MKFKSFFIVSCLSAVALAQEPAGPPEQPTVAPGAQAPSPSQAQALAPQPQSQPPQASEIEKTSYIPPVGAAYLDAGFASETSKATLKVPTGTFSTTKTTLTSFNYLFGYGVSDYLMLSLQGRIFMNNKSDYDYGPGSTSNGTSTSMKRSGWEEPEIGGIWRIRDNHAGKMRANLTAGVRPKLQQAKYATENADGNGGIGGTQFSAGLGLFKEVKDIELYFRAQRNFISVAKSELADDSSKTIEDDERQTTDIRIGFLAFTTEELSLGGSLLFNMAEKYTSTLATNGVRNADIDYDVGNMSAIELIGKYKVDHGSLLQLRVTTVLNNSQPIKIGNTKLDQQIDSATEFRLSWVQEF